MDWPTSEIVTSKRLRLEPLAVEHATEMIEVLADPSLYEYTGGEAPSGEQLRRRYAAQAVGRSEDGSQGWFNWIVKLQGSGAAVGFVQATVDQQGHGLEANIAWVISPACQGQRIATEATEAMIGWLRTNGVSRYVAFVHPEHHASMGVARNQGLHPTSVIEDGEIRWESESG